MDIKKIKRSIVVDNLPFDCWCVILTFLSSYEEFMGLVTTIKGLYEYIKKFNPKSTLNVGFEFINVPWEEKIHVSYLKIRGVEEYGYCDTVSSPILSRTKCVLWESLFERLDKKFPNLFRLKLSSDFQGYSENTMNYWEDFDETEQIQSVSFDFKSIRAKNLVNKLVQFKIAVPLYHWYFRNNFREVKILNLSSGYYHPMVRRRKPTVKFFEDCFPSLEKLTLSGYQVFGICNLRNLIILRLITCEISKKEEYYVNSLDHDVKCLELELEGVHESIREITIEASQHEPWSIERTSPYIDNFQVNSTLNLKILELLTCRTVVISNAPNLSEVSIRSDAVKIYSIDDNMCNLKVLKCETIEGTEVFPPRISNMKNLQSFKTILRKCDVQPRAIFVYEESFSFANNPLLEVIRRDEGVSEIEDCVSLKTISIRESCGIENEDNVRPSLSFSNIPMELEKVRIKFNSIQSCEHAMAHLRSDNINMDNLKIRFDGEEIDEEKNFLNLNSVLSNVKVLSLRVKETSWTCNISGNNISLSLLREIRIESDCKSVLIHSFPSLEKLVWEVRRKDLYSTDPFSIRISDCRVLKKVKLKTFRYFTSRPFQSLSLENLPELKRLIFGKFFAGVQFLEIKNCCVEVLHLNIFSRVRSGCEIDFSLSEKNFPKLKELRLYARKSYHPAYGSFLTSKNTVKWNMFRLGKLSYIRTLEKIKICDSTAQMSNFAKEIDKRYFEESGTLSLCVKYYEPSSGGKDTKERKREKKKKKKFKKSSLSEYLEFIEEE